ncbi:hypothetical protein [Catellatospora paridis]|uniref:hypothetical protein n=1 Tax=Catellatospora paridis TaxID=1617086 RepID=UPI0012D4456E|nr:hypothetical protein [Catellatospora paridis]
MFEENEFRALLNDADVPPTGVDVGRVLHAGRRRARHRSLAGVGGTLAVMLAVAGVVPLTLGPTGGGQSETDPTASGAAATAGPSAGPRTCTVTALAMPAEYQAWQNQPKFQRVEVNTADPTGRYIGGHAVIGQNLIPILWTDGVPQVLPIDPTTASIDAINEHGVVVGMASAAPRPYRYDHGTVTKLLPPPHKLFLYPQPYLNAAGDITMNAKPKAGYDDEAGTVVVWWRAGTRVPVVLPLSENARAQGIGDDGRIVGGTVGDAGALDAYLWDPRGDGRKLAGPAGTRTNAHAARGEWATGGAWRSGQQGPTVMLWNLRTGEARELAAGLGVGVNSSGWVVTSAPTATVLVDGVKLALPAVVAGGVAKAKAVADDGTVFGDSYDGDDSVPVRWRC